MTSGHIGHIYHVALSPDGNNVVLFNTDNLELRISQVKNLTQTEKIVYRGLQAVKRNSSRLTWSLAISNSINMGSHFDTLIAISCFNENDNVLSSENPHHGEKRPFNVRTKSRASLGWGKSSDHLSHLEQGVQRFGNDSQTWIISTWFQNRLITSLDNMGGVIRFLITAGNSTTLALVHSEGVTTTNIDHNYESKDLSFNTKHSISPTQDFLFPPIITDQIDSDEINLRLYLFNRSIEKNYFMVEDYNSGVLEMYSLIDGDLHKIFHMDEEKGITELLVTGNSIFEVSKNDVLLAYCHGANSVTIYLMENTLKITTKIFENVYRINSIDFINDDEKLLLVGEEERTLEDSTTELITVILIWDLFNLLNDSVKRVEDTQFVIPAKPHEHYHRFASASGKIVYVNEDDGNVYSIFDHPDLTNVVNPPPVSVSGLMKLDMQAAHHDSSSMYHCLYNLSGQFEDAKKEPKTNLIVSNPEPWVRHKKYPRVSAFLNSEKTQQVIVGSTTVQVWRRKKNPKTHEILQYIWSSPEGKTFQIKDFSIGNGEFFLEVSVGVEGDHQQIHWPHNCRVLVDACKALGYLYDRRSDQLSPKKQYFFDKLNQQINVILKRTIRKNPDAWRLFDVRYEIMENLIRGNCVSLIKTLLFEEERDKIKTRTSKQFHFSRLHAWPVEPAKPAERKKSDLQVAIECTGGNPKNSMIVGYLLGYYADNAMQNAGWMNSVSQTLPLLYDYNLGFFVKELFCRPIFGKKEMHINESFISKKDFLEARFKAFHALEVKPRLLKRVIITRVEKMKSLTSLSFFKKEIKEIEDDAKKMGIFDITKHESNVLTTVRIVPLPDFTVYPPGVIKDHKKKPLLLRILKIMFWPRNYVITDDEDCSPFLRVIQRDNSSMMFDNPAMAAVIDYKWPPARNHFIRHSVIFIIFALTFFIVTGALHEGSDVRPDVNSRVNIAFQVLLFYLGYYLLITEFIQLKHQGLLRYLTIYNFFDLSSVILPMVVVIAADIMFMGGGTLSSLLLMEYSIATAFTTLIIWGEMFLLLRFFKSPAKFIYIMTNILKKVWPFLAFMLIVVFGIGHAMYLLLRNPTQINLAPNGSSYLITNSSDTTDNLYPNITVSQTFDVSSVNDNYFSSFWKSIESV
ncbi:12296_t:CDS:2, partial [Acaulospora morrowiae]